MDQLCTSSLSPPVEQLLVAPVRHLLVGANDDKGNDATAATLGGDGPAACGGGWLTDTGLVNWSAFTSYRPSADQEEVCPSASVPRS